jgi:ribokinase
MHPAIVVVGSYVQDLTWRCPAFPREGETIVGRFATGPGDGAAVFNR